MIRTLSGDVNLNIHVRKCPDHKETNRNAIDAFINSSGFDPRVVIAVGLLRWIMDYQRSEIQILMESRGARVSTGEISTLSQEFLLRFYCIHRRHMKDLHLGEYILHLDGTGESGGDIVFMAKDGITGITMNACIMPSESVEYITPFLKGIKDLFGDPVAVMRDMSPAIKESISDVFPGILQLICHYHFVKALGKNVFAIYDELRIAIISTKALVKISQITVPENATGIIYAEDIWAAIASEYILYPRTIPSKFPFVLPYFQVLERCIEIESMLKSIIRWNAMHMTVVGRVMDLHALINRIVQDPEVLEKYRIISRTWVWFETVRKALRVARELSSSQSEKETVSIEAMGKDLNAAVSAVMKEGEFSGGELERISRIFHNRVEDHRAELLSPVIGKEGNTINVVRHNGIEEIGHRWSRMHIRRRTGRSQTGREMGMFGALTAVLSNMENKYYIDRVLSGIDFLKGFYSITKDELNKAKKLIRPTPENRSYARMRTGSPFLPPL